MTTPTICRICGARVSNDACDNKLCSGFGKSLKSKNSEEPNASNGTSLSPPRKHGLMNPGAFPVACLIFLGITCSLGPAGYWWYHWDEVRIAQEYRDRFGKSEGASPGTNPFDPSSPNYRRFYEMTQDAHRRPGDLSLAKNVLAQKQQKLDEVTKIALPFFAVGCSLLLLGLVQMARLMRTGRKRISARHKYRNQIVQTSQAVKTERQSEKIDLIVK